MDDRDTIRTHEAFLEAYETYGEPLFRHCYLRLLDRDLGKEITQETFKRTWQHIAEGQEIANAQLFLYRMANSLVREARAAHPVPDQIPQEITGEERSLLDCIRRLGKEHRDILVMHYIDRFSPPDIASIIGLSADTVSLRLSEGMRSMKSLLSYA